MIRLKIELSKTNDLYRQVKMKNVPNKRRNGQFVIKYINSRFK